MSKQQLSNVDKHKYTYTATGLFVIGAILFVIGSILLFSVSKVELQEAISGEKNNNELFT
ncbi:hypothetical protein QA612_12895 [Evansella sp. AB-P1]|uniref:hypothetical protein n=1 Tax=Evansella sp. AB-P1 TaxID=3037653 RepID=UPI00241FC2EF|nr:hypothetical protein [Evansella sp. AB-P1]MDG5788379.1 hypothetical protein [Evansella sp. AB-P1]